MLITRKFSHNRPWVGSKTFDTQNVGFYKTEKIGINMDFLRSKHFCVRKKFEDIEIISIVKKRRFTLCVSIETLNENELKNKID